MVALEQTVNNDWCWPQAFAIQLRPGRRRARDRALVAALCTDSVPQRPVKECCSLVKRRLA